MDSEMPWHGPVERLNVQVAELSRRIDEIKGDSARERDERTREHHENQTRLRNIENVLQEWATTQRIGSWIMHVIGYIVTAAISFYAATIKVFGAHHP